MNPTDLKKNEKKNLMIVALRVFTNALINGKPDESNQDITKSSSMG
jgi:hypothetical protein